MLMSQYKIILPSDYDMNIIRNRVKNNGYKTDGFPGLSFKLYLITVKGENNNIYNSYAPLYLWKETEGLNKFLFDGFYDNIIQSFGWQNVEINIPLINAVEELKNIKYVFEVKGNINQQISLKTIKQEIINLMPNIDESKYIVAYNPNTWQYQIFYFLEDLDKIGQENGVIYQVLHISL